MSFNEKYDYRWKEVIEPTLKAISASSSSNNFMLEPYRADTRKVDDSIITDILHGIGTCRVFFADLTATEYIDIHEKTQFFRNANVFYEVGLAQSYRLPEEVILFRSDNCRLDFDLANVRVNFYDPDNDPDDARRRVKEALLSAIREIDLRKLYSVQKAVNSLTIDCRRLLYDFAVNNKARHEFSRGTFNDTERNIELCNSNRLLLELGILRASYSKNEYGSLTLGEARWGDYEVTPFGWEVIKEMLKRYNLGNYSAYQKQLIDIDFYVIQYFTN